MTYIDVVFDGPPAHESGRFVEAEPGPGATINAEWIDRGNGLWALRITQPDPVSQDLMMLCAHGALLCARCEFIPESWKPAVSS